MKKITITIKMNAQHDIVVTNESTKKNLVISFNDKALRGKDIYDLLCFDEESVYCQENNLDDIEEGKDRDYFEEVINLFKDILKEVSDLNQTKEETGADIN